MRDHLTYEVAVTIDSTVNHTISNYHGINFSRLSHLTRHTVHRFRMLGASVCTSVLTKTETRSNGIPAILNVLLLVQLQQNFVHC